MLDSPEPEQVAARSTLVEKAAQANTYRLILRAQPHAIDEVVRLRKLLKQALRQFKFRCLRIEKVNRHER